MSLNALFRRCLKSFLLHLPKIPQISIETSKTFQFIRVWNFLFAAKVRGDYLEFGVYRGESFILSLRISQKFFAPGQVGSPRFFAFDSFEGLPPLTPFKDDPEQFQKGEYSASLDHFKKKVFRKFRKQTIHIVPGYYHESLTEKLYATYQLKNAAFVTIDCDLYESTYAALAFITPLLITGSVLYFDDWYSNKGNMSLGEPRACSEWLLHHPDIRLIEYGNVGTMGKLFMVNRL